MRSTQDRLVHVVDRRDHRDTIRVHMSTGALVSVPELQSDGLARLVAVRGGYAVIRFLATGAEMTQEQNRVVRYCLLPGTRVRVEIAAGADAGSHAGAITARRVAKDTASGLLVYGLRIADGREVVVREDAITALDPVEDPVEQLVTAQFNDLRPMFAKAGSALPPEPYAAQTAAAREELLAWRDAAWSSAAGVVGLASARIRPLPHQLLVARRALTDRQVRFLLADEVGLGKTIEAGLIIQSLLALKPGLRVLIIVPGALLSQWFLELYVRFGGQSYLMLDGERLREYDGNPWVGHQFVLASSRAVEELEGKAALRLATSKWDVVVVDECHRMQPGGQLYNRVAVLSKSTPHVLLLSATPARQHPDAYLALLALLQPQIWKTDDLAAFTARLRAHDEVVALLTRTLAAQDSEVSALAKAWRSLLPGDRVLEGRAKAMAADPAQRAGLIAYVREHHQLDRRIIRNRRQVLARLARDSGVAAIADTTRSREFVDYAPDAQESAVRSALADYRRALIGDEPAPPRLAHWLVQLELAVAAHPQVLERLLAMRAAVLADPGEFEAYGLRARPGETLAQVLRPDLSEKEIHSHIAVSAACHVDIAAEPAALATLREAVAAWHQATARKASARIRALCERLKRFWADHPDEKVLVFTTHALAIAPLAAGLRAAFGERTVETFGGHQDTVEREDAARRFSNDLRCPLLVSDPLGGEGRNFQFVSVVVHHDLPWSVAAVEQRIGRVDRLGRDGDIPSWILRPSGEAVDAAWGELLDTSVGVFAASSSGLEFVTDRLETLAIAAALTGGATAVRSAIPEAVALVAAERDARDRREDDCFHADATGYAATGRDAQAVDAITAPAGALARWIRGMGGEARREDEGPKAWKLRTRYGDEPVLGVFDRTTALANPELAFLGIGNHLVDRLVDDAASARWCAASAWRRPAATGMAVWAGVRAVFVLRPDYGAIAAAGLRLEVLRRLFACAPPLRVTVCVSESDAVVVPEGPLATLLAPPFSAKTGDTALSASANRDLWTRLLSSGEQAKVTAWQDGVRRAAAAANAHVGTRLPDERTRLRQALDARLDEALEAARSTAAAVERRHGAAHAETRAAQAEAADEERQTTALKAAVDGATFDLESIAYISVR